MVQQEAPVKERILRAAKSLYAEKGHRETKLREIASEAHTSESQVVKYFQSKAGVLDALLIQARSRIQDGFDKLQKENKDPVLVLKSIPSLLLDIFEKDPELLKVYLFSARYYTLIPEEQLNQETRLLKNLTGIFGEIKETKGLRGDLSPEVLSSLFWGLNLHMFRDKFYAKINPDYHDFSLKEMNAAVEKFIGSFVD